MAFAQLEPFGFHANWQPFALLAAIIANSTRAKKSQRAFKMEDFMPKEPKDRHEPMAWQDMLKMLKG